MDPLSITTGVLTCIGSAVATAKAIDHFKQTLKLPKEFNALFEEVSDLQTTLQQCSSIELVRSKGDPKDWCKEEDKSNLLDLDRHVRKANAKLIELENLIKDRRSSMGLRSPEQFRATWFNIVKGKNRLDHYKDDFRDLRMSIFTALNVFTASAVKNIENTVQGIATSTSQLASNQQQLIEAVYAWHQASTTPRPLTPQPQFSLPTYTEAQAMASDTFSAEERHVLNGFCYIDSFRFRFAGEEHVLEKFNAIQSEFNRGNIDEHAASRQIVALFSPWPDLVQGFNSFLPQTERMSIRTTSPALGVLEPKKLSASSFALQPLGSRRASSESPESRLAKSRAMFKASYTETGQCVPWCSCQCHSPVSIYSPRAIKDVVGTLNVTHSGLPYITKPCNQKRCLQRAQPRFRMSYKPPPALAATMFAMSVSMESLAGPEFKVRLPRVVGWNSPLWLYAREGNMDAVFNLFQAGLSSPWDVNTVGANMLAYATQTWNPEMARRLIGFGVDPSIEDDFRCSPAMYAWDRVLSGRLSGEDADMVASLFDKVDYISSCQFNPIHKIIFGMIDQDLADALETDTSDIDIPDSRGRTPISWAAARGDLKAVDLLIEAGADVKRDDWRNETPLHYARNVGVAKLLVEAGADVFAQNLEGQTPLYRAAKKNTNADLVRYLVNCGCAVNVKDRDGQTALDGTCSTTWYLPVVEVLLENGADINAKNMSDDTSLRFAIIYNSHEILRRMLEPQFGADFSGINTYGQGFAHAIARTADVETMDILTESRPFSLSLDVRLRDASNKTCMDYLEERLEYLSETLELREAWMRLAAALETNCLPYNEAKIEVMAEKLDISMRVMDLGSDSDCDSFADAREMVSPV